MKTMKQKVFYASCSGLFPTFNSASLADPIFQNLPAKLIDFFYVWGEGGVSCENQQRFFS